jgi:protein TonB
VAPAKERVTRAEPDDPRAIALKGRDAKKRKMTRAQMLAQYMKDRKLSPNQVTGSEGQALSTPMVGTKGAGGVGVGAGTAFGTRFGWYQQLLQQKIAEKWRTQDVDVSLQSAPLVIVSFDIVKDGTIRRFTYLQKSGNYSLDMSARKAVEDAAPFPALPDGYDKSTAQVEINFQFKR